MTDYTTTKNVAESVTKNYSEFLKGLSVDTEAAWKKLFEASLEETDNVRSRLISLVGSLVKSVLAEDYDEYVTSLVVKELKWSIENFEEGNDRWETPDNSAHDLASMYRALAYYMVPSEYKEYVQQRREVKFDEV